MKLLLAVPRAPSGGSWAPLGSHPSSSLFLGRPRCLREVFGGHFWSTTSPRMVPPKALRQPKCSHLYNKNNDFRRAPVCRNWCQVVPRGSRRALQGPPKAPERAPQGDPRSPQGASWGPFSRAVPGENATLGPLFPLVDFTRIPPAPKRERHF